MLFAQSLDGRGIGKFIVSGFYLDVQTMQRQVEEAHQQFLLNFSLGLIAVMVVCGIFGSTIGGQKGQGQLGFWLGFLLGPLGVLVAALLPAIQNAQVQGPPPLPQYRPPQTPPPLVYDNLEMLDDAKQPIGFSQKPAKPPPRPANGDDIARLYRARTLR